MFHSDPEFIAITPEMRERLEKFRTQHANDKVGKVANHVLFEDENVRIWEMKLEPGEHSDLHHHAHDYYRVIDSGDLVAGIPPRAARWISSSARFPHRATRCAFRRAAPSGPSTSARRPITRS
jgi:hypothetical protein